MRHLFSSIIIVGLLIGTAGSSDAQLVKLKAKPKSSTPAKKVKKVKKAKRIKKTKKTKKRSKARAASGITIEALAAQDAQLKAVQAQVKTLQEELARTSKQVRKISAFEAEASPEETSRQDSIRSDLASVDAKIAQIDKAIKNGLDPQLAAKPLADLKKQKEVLQKRLKPVHTPLPKQLEALKVEQTALRESVASLRAEQKKLRDRKSPQKKAQKLSKKQKKGIKAGYKGGFFIAHDKFKVVINGRVQARFAFEALDGETDETQFSIPRARLALKGHAFSKSLSYKFQADFGKGSVALKDFYVNYAFIKKWLHVRVGQYKRPFSRQQLTSSGKQEFVDRALTDKAFGGGRDIGVMLHNNFSKSPTFEYALGIFNGTGDKGLFSGKSTVDTDTGKGTVTSGKFSNVPDVFQPALVLRLGFNVGEGVKGYSEADLEGGGFRFSMGASGLVGFDTDDDDSSAIRGQLDYMLKAYGFSSTGGVYVASKQDGAAFSDQAFSSLGFHVQAGYVIAKRFQPTFRYAMIAPDGDDNNDQAYTLGFSAYFFKHKMKLQTDGTIHIDSATGGAATNYRLRTQVQLAF
jgi:phosphate-selective porin OprO and OprP